MVEATSVESGGESSEAEEREADPVFLAALSVEEMPESWSWELGSETLEAFLLLEIRNAAEILNGLMKL